MTHVNITNQSTEGYTLGAGYYLSADWADATFKRRSTSFEQAKAKDIYSDSFKTDESKVAQWKAFLNKNDLAIGLSFAGAIEEIHQFMEPIHNKSKNNSSFVMQWDAELTKWQSN